MTISIITLIVSLSLINIFYISMTNLDKFINIKVILLLISNLSLFSNISFASPFYRETFKLCSALETSSKNANDIAGWKAFRGDSAIGKLGFLKVNTPGSPNHPLSFNSFPVGQEEGSAFWSKITSELTVFTDEFSFNLKDLDLVQYEQRLGGYNTVSKLNDSTQLALLIGDKWYISDQSARQVDRGVWEPVSFIPRQLTYGTYLNKSGKGPEQPKNFGIKLPQNGIITAFGIFVAKVNGKIRIDNFTLSDSSLDARTPGEQGSAAQCVDQTSTGGLDQNSAFFCKGAASFALGQIKASSKIKEQLLLSISGKSLQAVRDRALLALLLTNNLRIDNLVNVSVQDYFRIGNLQMLKAAGTIQKSISIKRNVKRMVDQYIKAAKLSTKGSLPFMQQIDTRKRVTTNAALCTADIRKIVTRRARTARLGSKVKILP